MTKRCSSSPMRRRLRGPWIAMLATLAFAGAGQALAPAPAAALRIEACVEPKSGLCNPVDDGTVTGDYQSGQSGQSGSGSSSVAPWNQREPDGTPTWMVDPVTQVLTFQHYCGLIKERIDGVLDRLDEVNDTLDQLYDAPGDLASRVKNAQVMKKKLKRQLRYYDNQRDSWRCEKLGL